ncbi:hypothetical protein [Streptococcus oralis]|uniref:Uncharacterized protein n=1 Tax=Streptococcus oralis subsp. dentisani TaxID=1458253 RepID=A0A1X1JES0_STROR|nr:hypothetical protein [Streptococcus oralis]ORO85621.1 hypothetical protein B7705_00655 [Streptococcus oralis subsp. dentisani]
MKTRTPDGLRLSGVFGSLSTVEGEIELSMRENQIDSLFSNIQSNENRHSKIFEILKIKYYTSYILADCLQLDIGIKRDGLPFLNALKNLMMSR